MGKRIAIVAFSAPPYSSGGVSSAHFNLFRALQKVGCDVRLFTFGDFDKLSEKEITRRGAPPWIKRILRKLNSFLFGVLEPKKKAYQVLDIITSMLGSWRMSKEISRFQPDVIIWSDHGAPALMMRKQAGTIWIWISHHNPGRFSGSPHFMDSSVLDVRWAIQLENRALRNVDIVVCPSNYMKVCFTNSYTYSGQIQVIANLLDESTTEIQTNLNFREQNGLRSDQPVIYLPSAGSRLKGSEFTKEIVKRLIEKYRGPLAFYIPGFAQVGFVEELNISSRKAVVIMPGQLQYDQHISNVKACSFGISPSLLENYSMALLEAVSCGVPILAFNTGGNTEIISDSNNGYLVDEGDVNELCLRAQDLLHPEILEALRKKTFEYSRVNLSLEKPLRAYLDLIEAE